MARQLYGVEIVKFEDLDLFDDLDGLIAMTKSLHIGVASKYSSCLDMMAVNNIPVLTFDRGRTERNLGTDYIPWFPSAKCFGCAAGTPAEPVVERMAQSLREFVDANASTPHASSK